MHLPVWRRLSQQAAEGRLTVLEGWEVTGAAPCLPAQQQHSGDGDGSACSTSPGWRLTVRRQEDVALTRKQAGAHTLFQQAVGAAAAAASGQAHQAGQQDATQQGATQQGAKKQDKTQQAQQVELGSDLIWLACGRAYDAAADPVLRTLRAQRPTLVAGGYPLIDAEHMCWPGAAVYLAGRSSLLATGPCAGGFDWTQKGGLWWGPGGRPRHTGTGVELLALPSAGWRQHSSPPA